MLWVHHRIRWIRIWTSDEEVIKKRRLRNQSENEWKKEEMEMMMMKMIGKMKESEGFIKVENIHFNPPGKFSFKSNSFSCNLVLNYNLVRKLIPN